MQARDPNKTDTEQGLYRKFVIDGVGDIGKCFILDLDHDPYAAPAVEAYRAAGGTAPIPTQMMVTRTDGSSSVGGKHHGCRYAVMQVEDEAAARAAVIAYATACKDTHPDLSNDLAIWMLRDAEVDGRARHRREAAESRYSY